MVKHDVLVRNPKSLFKITRRRKRMRKKFAVFALGVLVSVAVLGSFGFVATAENGPKTGDVWICPSVPTKNPNGMWVIGGRGAYYIIKPGTASDKWPMILNPTKNLEEHAARVHDQAQVPAGWGLYSDLESYPYLDTGDGMAVVLHHGAGFIYNEFGIELDPMSMIHVEPSEDASYDADTMTLYANVPLFSAVFW